MNFSSPRFCRYRPAAVLRVSGEDAASFLQGQFTQELRSTKGHPIAYGLWLNQKGKVLADSFVLRPDDDHWVIVSLFSEAAVIRERLEAYVIADDVTVEDVTQQWMGLAVLGDATDAILHALGTATPAEGEFVGNESAGWIFQGRRCNEKNWEWLHPVAADDPAVKLRAAGVAEIETSALERLRIEAAIPAVPRDVGPEDLPNEGGLERDAISYTKGCYLGQEVMARLKSMGRIRRQLMQVSAAGDFPAALPAPLFDGAKKVGELRSAARTENGFVGLAMLSLLGLDGARPLAFAPDAPAIVLPSSHARA